MFQRGPVDLAMIRQITLFRALDDAQLRQVAARLKERRFRKSEIIFHQGDPGNCMYIIVSGRVRIYLLNEDGREVTFRIYQAQAAFGEFAVLDEGPRSASASALSDIVTLVLYRQDFMALMREHFSLVEHVVTMLTERLRYTTNYSTHLAFLSVPGRVAAVLIQLASADLVASEPIRVELTQQDLAAFANTTREWVNRALRDFADMGLVQLERGAVIVLDRAGLQGVMR